MTCRARLPRRASPTLVASLALALATCAWASASSERQARPNADAGAYAPRVDHHLHLLSRAGADSKIHTEVLPPDLAEIEGRRESQWNNEAGLSGVFTADAALFNGYRWLEGMKAIFSFAGNFTGPYRFRPVNHRVVGDEAEISGVMAEASDTTEVFAFFHQELRRSADGSWKIRSETELFPGPTAPAPVLADDLVKSMSKVGIRRGVVLSDAYYFALTPAPTPGELDRVKAENDWTAQQVGQFPDRLVAFFSVNPLREYALAEVERCASSHRFRGLKLHFNAAQLDFHDPAQVAKVRAVMARANQLRLPMVIHVRSSDSYGRADAELFLHQLVAAAPDVPIQIAHLWGGESFSGPALEVYADAVSRHDPVAKNLYFDISGAWRYSKPEETKEIVARVRQIGLSRVLYGSDDPIPEAWAAFRHNLPLTDAEFRVIARNVAPYMQDSAPHR